MMLRRRLCLAITLVFLATTAIPPPVAEAQQQQTKSVTRKKATTKKATKAKKAKATRGVAKKEQKAANPRAAKPKRLAKKQTTIAAYVPDWTWMLRGGLVVGAMVLLWQWRRQDRLNSSPERDMRVVPQQSQPAFGAHVPRAVVLEYSASPDPLTVDQDHTIDQWAGLPKPASVNDDANAAAELDAIVTSIHLKQNDPHAGAAMPARPASSLALPPELGRHFEGQPQETLVWSTTFNAPLFANGTIAVTSQRILSVYRRQFWRVLPPGREVQVRRHQIHRDSELRTEVATTRRPSLLVAGLVCVAWFPIGTVVAAVAFGLYFVAGRRELAIMHKRVRRLYPLASVDIEAAINACKTESSSTAAPGAPARAS